MARYSEPDMRGGAWRALAWAAGGAAIFTLMLSIAVGLIWLLGRTPSTVPALDAGPTATPTPRALSFVQRTPTPEPPPETPTPEVPAETPTATAVVVAEAEEERTEASQVTPTPELLAMSTEDEAATVTEGESPVLAAPDETAFATLASGSWTAAEDTLVNAGQSAVAEPLLTLVTVPGPAFAVEAEIRVTGVLDSVCDQSFGLAGGSASLGKAYGGGVLFPCGASQPRARLTDVSVWQDGYNADPVIAEEAFNPGEEWHTYRFEVRGERLRLVVDGESVVSGTPDTAFDPSVADIEAGLWSQGAGIKIRRVAVYQLPAE